MSTYRCVISSVELNFNMFNKILIAVSCVFIASFVSADNSSGSSFGGGSISASPSLFSGSSGSSVGSNSSSIVVPSISGGSSLGSSSVNLNSIYAKSGNDNKSISSALSSGELSGNVDSAAALNNSKAGINHITAFQNDIFIRTGQMLPIYGRELFVAPNSFSPNQNLPVPENYVIGPGDSISMQTWGSVDSNLSLIVGSDGTIFIPKVGTVNVTGVRASQLDAFLTKKVGRIYKQFSLASTVGNVSSIQITVSGFAQKAGNYNLSSLSTFANAILAVGGPSASGSLRDIELRRSGQLFSTFDLYDLLLGGVGQNSIRLQAGDVIYFRPVGAQVAIYEGVKVPGIYEAKPTDKVIDVVNFAGGYSYNNRGTNVILEKISENKAINVFNYKLAAGVENLVTDGEVIHFFTTNNEYSKSIVLIGNVANPTRTNFHEGMTVRDVIPDKNMLLSKSYWNSYNFNAYGRDSLLTGMGQEKSTFQSGKISATSSASGYNSSSQQSLTQPSVFGGQQNLFIAGPVQVPEADINWNYALIVRTDPETFQSKLIPFNLKLALHGDLQNNLQLQAGDIINILSSKDVRSPARAGVLYVFVDGEVNKPGVYELSPNATLKDLLRVAGGTTDDAYLFGMELNRSSVKQRQIQTLSQMLDQLQQTLLAQASDAVLTNSSSQGSQTQQVILQQQQAFIDKMRKIQPTGRVVLNLKSSNLKESDLPKIVLENGDTVYLPPTPSVIDVVGQVYNPATFEYDKHSTVEDYIRIAGTENRFADINQEYILRADGTLFSKQQAGWFGGFGSQTLRPGDAIIVPQQIQFGGLVQNLLNWTQILSNFGTAAAAITIFK